MELTHGHDRKWLQSKILYLSSDFAFYSLSAIVAVCDGFRLIELHSKL